MGCWPFKSPGSHFSRKELATVEAGVAKMANHPTFLFLPLKPEASITESKPRPTVFFKTKSFCPLLLLQNVCKLL